ncbi:uncharacterized protein [Temnothorax nylanderi]|uniref:uncharacterized protein n=1 Tax=Temnothorax nylanderi TaxID=102681 RepID=UPI003A8BEADB
MGLADPSNDWKKCPVIVEHSYSTYNVARKAAMKKADTGQALDSEITDGEKGRGKRRVTKKKHFDDSDSSKEDMDNVSPVLNPKKKKKTIIVQESSDSEDDRTLLLPSPQISGVRERLKALQQRNASTSKDVSGTLYTQKSTSVFGTSTKANVATSSEPQKEKQITSSMKCDKRLSSMKTPDKTSSNRTFIDDEGCTEASYTTASNRSSPSCVSVSKKKISRDLFPLSRNNDGGSNKKWPHLIDTPRKFTRDSFHHVCERENCSTPQQAYSSQPMYSASSVEVIKVELLHELNSKLDFIMIQNQRIIKQLYPEEAALKKPKDFPSLPLQSKDDFNNFEKFLQTEINLISTADFFHAVASDCVLEGKAAGKLMRKCVSNRLSRVMSWDGTNKTKLSFNKSKLKESIFCSLLKLYPGSKLLDVEAAIKRWLNTSAQRLV